MDKSTIADPTSHYGHAKAATRHFITQRLSGALNVLFLLFFVWFVVRLAGSDRADMVSVVANPFVAIVLVLLIVNVAVHMRIGMGEVIDDYVQEPRVRSLCLTLNTFFALAVVVLTVGAVAKIVFWG